MTLGNHPRIATFTRPFTLAEFGRQFPAGRYLIEPTEEPPDGSFLEIYPPAAATMHLIAGPNDPCIAEQTIVHPFQLEAALALDATLADMSDAGEMLPLIAAWRVANGTAQTEAVAGIPSTKVAP